MKLMIVTHNMAGGGCERVIARLLWYFTACGDDCSLVTECAGASFYDLPALTRHALSESQTMRASDVPRVYMRLRRLVKRDRPDIVLAMPEKVNVWTLLFLLGTGVPVVVSERNDPMRHPESRVKRLLRRLIYPRAAGFVFQTRMAADYFPPRVRARGIVLDNPLDIGRMPPANTGAREKTVVGAGRLAPQKNFPLLIRAFAAFCETHPDWRLIIFGEGEGRAALEALAAELLPAGAWALPGQTDRLYGELRSAGMFVLSSDFEGMPNALMEAMALGAPCVATDCRVGGPAALIQDGVNGLLVPVADEAALSRAMGRIADDAAFAGAMSGRAAEIRARLSADIVCKQWRDYLGKRVAG